MQSQRVLIAVLFLALTGCASAPEPVAEIGAGFLQGYLASEALPDSLRLLPPPPAPGTPQLAADEAVYRSMQALRGTPRWALAIEDADLRFPNVVGTFSCAVGAPITASDTPHLYQLLRRSATDAGRAMNAAKDHYQRTRPFAQQGVGSCTPDAESRLMRNGSYPSGHTAIGWAWALILGELAADRIEAVVERGYAFGQSRVVCAAHWQSDVDAARVVTAAVVARLHGDPTFRADLERARAELQSVRNQGLVPTRDCSAESAALTFRPQGDAP